MASPTRWATALLVTDLDASGRRFAGLVICWALTPEGGWAGRTIYIVDDEQPTVVIEAWVPAAHLRPACDLGPN